ncbi:Hypothetical protein NTJ_10130 [Nesidiocoris tenuis]|uniref:Uncharacterized protein n=1 Tax=Nesidiocoris tenuis TaxID=355587 RepID=A0ABN7AYR8_9HEMI|nr:Hypothetical protein NTJ_10130 [Nesidiocoris tenuis]
MDSDRRKNLYLLEVMVTNVEIDADVLLENFTFDPEKVRLIDATTKVTFSNHFELDIDCLASVIRVSSEKQPSQSNSATTLELDRSPNSHCENETHSTPIQAGKSCLFPMKAEKLMSDLESCPLYIQVFNQDEDSNEDTSPGIFLGKAKLDLSAENFINVVAGAESYVDLPISACFRSTLPLTTVFGIKSGQISIYVRLSCFGKSILSGFSYVKQQKPVNTSPLKSNINVGN